MPAKYTFYYFGGRGRGETVRQMLHLGGVQWEDVRFEKPEWDAGIKAQMPLGKCPMLVIENGQSVTRISESHAIIRYLARCWGYAGESLLDQCYVDQVADAVEDQIVRNCVMIRREQDPVRKEERIKLFADEQLPTILGHLETKLKQNKGGDGYFVGDSMTWCDMLFTHWVSWVPDGVKVTPPMDQHPKLKALCHRVESHPKIAEWLKKRPVTDL